MLRYLMFTLYYIIYINILIIIYLLYMIVIFEYFSKLWILSLIEIGTDVPLTRFQKKREMEAISKRSRLLETTNPESGSVFEIFNIF